jgi:hypothetical protein
MRPSVESQGVSIVMVGKLNPAIMSPAWLAKHGLISDDEMIDAKLNVIHPEITQFVAGSYGFDITQQRFLVRSSNEPFVQVLDLVVGVFGELLVHTPIQKVGINFDLIFKCRSPKQRVELGRRLAPIEPWGDFGKRMKDTQADKVGGMISLTMQENLVGRRGYRRVEIEPVADASSARAKININDHYEVADIEKASNASEIVDVLLNNFETSLAESRRIAGELVDYSMGLPS